MTETKKIRVAIVERDEQILEKLVSAIEKDPAVEVTSTLISGDTMAELEAHILLHAGKYIRQPDGSNYDVTATSTFLNELQASPPDVLAMSLKVLKEAATMNLKGLKAMQRKMLRTKLIVLSERFAEETIPYMIGEGITGYYLTTLPVDTFSRCMKVVCDGEIWMDRILLSRTFDELARYYRCWKKGQKAPDLSIKAPMPECEERLKFLTDREMEILQLLSQSLSNSEIAARLFISSQTVKTHVRNIFEKIGIKNRVEATLLYVKSSMTDQWEQQTIVRH